MEWPHFDHFSSSGFLHIHTVKHTGHIPLGPFKDKSKPIEFPLTVSMLDVEVPVSDFVVSQDCWLGKDYCPIIIIFSHRLLFSHLILMRFSNITGSDELKIYEYWALTLKYFPLYISLYFLCKFGLFLVHQCETKFKICLNNTINLQSLFFTQICYIKLIARPNIS